MAKTARPRTMDVGLQRRLFDIGGVRPTQALMQLEREVAGVLGQMSAHGLAVDLALAHQLDASYVAQMLDITSRHPGMKLTSPTAVDRYIHDWRVRNRAYKFDDVAPMIEDITTHRKLVAYQGMIRRIIRATTSGRVHPHHEQLGSDTGRIVVTKPDLQGMPKRSWPGRRIRQAIVAGPGRVFVACDWRQVELRIAAAISDDATLIEAFRSGRDPLIELAAELGISRDQAKTLTYRIFFGSDAYGVAEALFGETRKPHLKRAQAIIDGMFAKWPAIATLFDRIREKATATGAAWTHNGLRRRALPDATGAAGKRAQAKAHRGALSQSIQGSAADILKRALVRLSRALPAGSHLALTVHDECIAEVPAASGAFVAGLMSRVMVEAVGELGERCPFEVEASIGPNLLEMKPASEYQCTSGRRADSTRLAPIGDLESLDPRVQAAVGIIRGVLDSANTGDLVDLRVGTLRRLCGRAEVNGLDAHVLGLDWLMTRGEVIRTKRRYHKGY